MINVETLKRTFEFILNKEGKGSITPLEFNTTMNSALYTFINKNFGVKIQGGRLTGFAVDSEALDRFNELIVEHVLITNKHLPKPDGIILDESGNICEEYMHMISVNVQYIDKDIKEYAVEFVAPNEFEELKTSEVRKPTLRFPKATIYSNEIKVLPQSNRNKYRIVYLRQPKEAKWGYTLVNNRPIYNPNDSQDIEIAATEMNAILNLMLQQAGINLRDADVLNYSLNQSKNVDDQV